MKQAFLLVVLICAVAILSSFSTSMWGGKPEKLPENISLQITSEMTVKDFIEANAMEKPAAKALLGLTSPSDLQKPLTDFGTPDEIQKKYKKSASIKAEKESKNWFKIPLKFAMWAVFLVISFIMLKRGKITSGRRKVMYAVSFTLFGVVMGADPGPMGTVKDAVFLYGKSGAIFPPRMVALSIFLLTVILANKFICSWGCQIGTLQDFIFRLGRNRKDTGESLPQYKIPFALSNSFRLLIFIAMFVTAFAFATDLFESIDPFKIFKPATISLFGWIFTGAVFLLSLFTYRPWCSLFCPFGFVGWLFEKISIFRIRVNYDTCIACGKCSTSCPSTVMDAILKQDKKTIPDCFSCGVCVNVCPTASVSFSKGKRKKVPEGKF